jgi:hypothetical protein
MPLGIDCLKVDQTALPAQHGALVFLSNVNVPARYLDNEDTRATFERVRHFVVSEYGNVQDIYYQFTSAYELRHTATGQIRTFTGTFHPAGNATAAITDFRIFGADFVDHALERLTLRNIRAKLDFFDQETVWVIHRIRSVIVNVQALVDRGHGTIARRNLHNARNKRRSRTHVTFYL